MVKNSLAIIFLVFFFGGFIWFVGGEHSKSMQDTIAETSAIKNNESTPLVVDAYTCHYLIPNTLDKIINRLLCWSCVSDANKLRENFIISNSQEYCGGRGKVSLSFTRKPF
jgi:hypothetical protein